MCVCVCVCVCAYGVCVWRILWRIIVACACGPAALSSQHHNPHFNIPSLTPLSSLSSPPSPLLPLLLPPSDCLRDSSKEWAGGGACACVACIYAYKKCVCVCVCVCVRVYVCMVVLFPSVRSLFFHTTHTYTPLTPTQFRFRDDFQMPLRAQLQVGDGDKETLQSCREGGTTPCLLCRGCVAACAAVVCCRVCCGA